MLTARQIETRVREDKALELRRAGYQFQEIAEQLGITKSAAWKAIKRRYDQIGVENAEGAKLADLDRLEALLQSLWARANAGDLATVDRVLRIMEHHAMLLGLEAPKQSKVQIGGTLADFLALAEGATSASSPKTD